MEIAPTNAASERRALVLVSACFVALWAAVLGGIHHLGSSGPPGDEYGSAAFGAAFLAAALVAVIGILRCRPWLIAFAGFALVPMTLATFNPMALPLLPAAAVLLANGFGGVSTGPRFAVVLGAAGLLLVGALAALLVHEDPARWTTDTGSAGSSDTITGTEAAWSLSLAAAAVVLAFLEPVRRRTFDDA